MANIDNQLPVVADSLEKEDNGQGGASASLGSAPETSDTLDISVSSSSPDAGATNDAPTPASTAQSSAHPAVESTTAKPATASQPTLVQLNPVTTPVAPQPKKFTAVNVSKKFLQKNSTPADNASAQSSSSLKPAGPSVRLALAPSAHSSRLVTAKLTATSQPSTTTGPGWSRPSSAAPTSSTPNGAPSQLSANTHGKASGPPSLPHAGKVIQPQPRAAGHGSFSDMLAPNKPVWGKVPSASRTEMRVQSDFPTAAEVAQSSRAVKGPPMPESNDVANAANKQARMEEADTFRGIHLDPNAHHWDEMEEDDNFFDSVVEFEDGRRYEVETAAAPTKPPTPPSKSSSSPPARPAASTQAPPLRAAPPSDIPVSKEERFADDFDRSWPRSSPSLSSVSGHQGASNAPVGPAPSPKSPAAPLHSPEASRVLFNERSNRLEPYSNAHRPGPTSYAKRVSGDGQVDAKTSTSNVHVLQKPVDRPRLQMNGSGPVRGDFPRRDSSSSSGFSAPMSRDSGFPGSGNSGFVPPQDRGRRMSNMGPPPVPNHALRGSHRDMPPPRQAWSSQPNAFPGRVPSRDARHPSAPPSTISVASIAQSPVLSHTSAAPSASSPIIAPMLPPNADLDELRKDVMQNAAARAKQRRQQEEEEREKERERAKQKAAELEARIKAAQSAKAKETALQEEAVAIIEEAKKEADSATVTKAEPPAAQDLERRSSFASKAHLSRQESRPAVSRRDSTTSHTGGVTPSVSVDSWRSHANPPPPPSAPRQVQARPRKPSLISAPSIFDHVDTLKEDPDIELEVVDFSDFGKFMGVSESDPEPMQHASAPESAPAERSSQPPQTPRPVASDFFEDKPPPPPPPPQLDPTPSRVVDTAAWRRKETVAPHTEPVPSASRPAPPQQESTHLSPHKPRPQYKEANMTALDDAMSRIKGALDGMHGSEGQPSSVLTSSAEPKLSSSPAKQVKERWVPPALRLRLQSDHDLKEFPRTIPDPPHSPKPAWNTFSVRLPKTSKPVDMVSKRQLVLFNKLSLVRWEILSFEPPVEGMSRRDLSVNDVLFRPFRPSPSYKGKIRYKVALPKASSAQPLPTSRADTKPVGGAFGRASNANDVSSWRAPPPKVAESSAPIEATTTTPSSPVRTERPKLPKMPVGSSVAFYRDSQVVNAESDAKAAVNFIVTSELEESEKEAGTLYANSSATSSGLVNGNVAAATSVIEPESPTTTSELTTMSPHAAPWPRTPLVLGGVNLKESPVRAPDPEHLKALWSSTSHPSELHPVNSLEGIADDLISVPFTLQDVKSEDGETPPPTMSGPSRMSLHDVTRAFQQVPSSSTVTPHRPTISPPTTTAPVARPPPNYSYGLPMPPPPPPNNQNMRSSYPQYPILSQSPAPMVYPMSGSPVPTRMQVGSHTPMPMPMYGPPQGWMPLPPNGPGGQPPMMRPYPQMMSYSPSAQPIYLPSPQSMPNMQPAQGVNGNRSRSVSVMMSPGMVHAAPAMYGSPVMMHAGRGAGPMRNDSNQSQPPQPANPYTPTNSFMRPSW